jgi:hypothetical protein
MKKVLLVVVVGVVGFYVWGKFLSNDARIESAYRSCTTKFVSGSDVKIDFAGKLAPEDAGHITEGEQTVTAFCGSLRDTCRADFNGKVCQALLGAF